MSHLWSERLHIALLSDCLVWVIKARGWKNGIRAQGSIPIAMSEQGVRWQEAMAVLLRELPRLPISRGKVSIVLSNTFVRYLIINCDVALADHEERLALAKHDFQKIHGVVVENWEICIAAGGKNYLAVALDRELLVQLRDCFAVGKIKLISVQPYAVASLNHWAKHLDEKIATGFFLAESHSYSYFCIQAGKLAFFHTGHLDAEPMETYRRVVQRAILRSGVEIQDEWLAPSSLSVLKGEAAQTMALPSDEALRTSAQLNYLVELLGAM
ncbi:MAG: hypothetical protein PHI11_05155 [Gallionella sp.]|nr:hypothetical protein [Gallionella sp.]